MQEPETPVFPDLKVQAHDNHLGQAPTDGTDSTDEGWR